MWNVLVALLLLGVGRWTGAELQPVLKQVTEPVEHGEGPHWDGHQKVLYFVDIHQQLVNRYDPATNNVSHVKLEGGEVSLVIPVADTEDKFVVSVGLHLVLLTWNGVDEDPDNVEYITSVEADKDGNRFNDGKADRCGRIWAGTMGPEKIVGEVTPDQGSLYSLNPNSFMPETEISPVSVSNGLAWTSDNKIFYYIDTPTLQIAAYDFDIQSGSISNRRVAFDLKAHNISGFPDGMTIDSNNNLWVAVFDGAKVLYVDPRTGSLLGSVEMPVTRVTSLAFGGDNLETLYATTSRFGLTEEQLAQQPLAGSVFAITGLGVRGTHPNTAIRTVQ
ncbi:regucalcin [Anabrus simplex]|uniref:regucalcin n=1 Tax=Anabrus simplex TaxID=316456 RepID=UPI0035A2D86D